MNNEKRTNDNCLAGIQCPKCGSEETFFIVGTAVLEVTDDGVEDFNDADWEEDSYIRCRACDHQATVKDFTIEETKDE